MYTHFNKHLKVCKTNLTDLYCFVLLSVPLTSVQSVAGMLTNLPCNITPALPGDKVNLVLWYKDGFGKPLFRYTYKMTYNHLRTLLRQGSHDEKNNCRSRCKWQVVNWLVLVMRIKIQVLENLESRSSLSRCIPHDKIDSNVMEKVEAVIVHKTRKNCFCFIRTFFGKVR